MMKGMSMKKQVKKPKKKGMMLSAIKKRMGR